jgi:hypothetical protein
MHAIQMEMTAEKGAATTVEVAADSCLEHTVG